MALQFCQEISEYFIYWLKTNKLNLRFPILCGLASEILYTYIEAYFPNKIILAKGHHKNDFVGLHVWIELEDLKNNKKYIIDSTYYQYYDIETKDILICDAENLKNVYDKTDENNFDLKLYLLDILDQNFKHFLFRIENTQNKQFLEKLNMWRKEN